LTKEEALITVCGGGEYLYYLYLTIEKEEKSLYY